VLAWPLTCTHQLALLAEGFSENLHAYRTFPSRGPGYGTRSRNLPVPFMFATLCRMILAHALHPYEENTLQHSFSPTGYLQEGEEHAIAYVVATPQGIRACLYW
jgi:hypothetical protein